MKNSVGKEMAKLISQSGKKETKAYDTQAEVVRVEGLTAWVHIPGGVDETPVSMTMNAKAGEMVQVRVSGGRAWLTGNASSPPTDDTKANAASELAYNAKILAEASEREAKRAREAADIAEESAKRAREKATEAETAAGRALTKATDAEAAAGRAETEAIAASRYANGALSQLSVVENVVGTLNWISEHGSYSLTGDTQVIPGKHYFILRDGKYIIVLDPEGSPAQQGYYELSGIDEAVSNYVASHLSLTDDGLWVTKDDFGYKLLLSGEGMKVYDDKGSMIANFGGNVVIGKTSEWHQRINPGETVFAYGEKIYTYLTPGKILTENLEVNGSYYIDNFSIRVASDGHLVVGRRT